jgi:hypothetical protein
MINNPDWHKPKIKPYLHQLSLDCIEEIAVFMEGIDTDETDCDTRLILQEILSDEIEDEEFLGFAIDNLDELLSYIAQGNLNIRVHRDITGEMWFGVGEKQILCSPMLTCVSPCTCPRPNTPTLLIGFVYFSLIPYLCECIVCFYYGG